MLGRLQRTSLMSLLAQQPGLEFEAEVDGVSQTVADGGDGGRRGPEARPETKKSHVRNPTRHNSS